MSELLLPVLGEGLQEVPRESRVTLGALLVLAPQAAREVVDRVVATPQDPVVAREAVVVEPVSRVGHTLAIRPADARALLVGERLRHERVVPDGDHRSPHAAHRAPEGVGGDEYLARRDEFVPKPPVEKPRRRSKRPARKED